VDGRSSNGLVVVAVVEEHGAEVADDVDDEEDGTLTRLHCEVAAVLVALHGVPLGSLGERIVDDGGRAENVGAGIGGESEDDDNDEQDESMHPVSQNRRLEATEHGVRHNADGEQVNRSNGVHASQGRHGGRTTDDQHERHEDVGDQAEDHEDDVGEGAVSRLDHLEEGVSVGRASLELDSEGGEEENLDGSTRGIPEGARNTVAVANTGALEQSGGPGPRRHDGRADQSRLHGTASRVEHLGCLEFPVVSFQDERHQDHTCGGGLAAFPNCH